ncbi:MAG: VWA domain-containing protein [Pirellulales bacterium]|nr:VWA domain-containing protein [Pirellulales bacterium]
MWMTNLLNKRNKTRRSSARNAQTKPSRLGRHLKQRHLQVEPLEERRLLTVSAALVGNVVTFLDTVGNHAQLELQLNGAGELEWSDGGAFTNDLDTATFGTQSAVASTLQSILVLLGDGDDSLAIRVAGTDLIHSGLITYDGGAGFNTLAVDGDPVYPVASTTYTPGPEPGSGRLVYDDGFLMQIDFQQLAPVLDLVPSALLIVNGTNADNAINYSGPGPNSDGITTGVVSVDGFETIEFANKSDLVINGLAGSDTINLNNPTRPDGLNGITVDGGDPTAGSDVVIVNGTAGKNSIVVDNFAIGEARVAGAQRVPVDITGAERLMVDGRGGNDDMAVQATSDDDTIVYTPAGLDSGLVRMVDEDDEELVLPLFFQNLGLDADLSIDGRGDSDRLVYNGSDLNDHFRVDDDNIDLATPVGAHIGVDTDSIEQLVLNGLDGDDTFELNGNVVFSQVDVNGGNPDAGSDSLVLLGNNGVDEDLKIEPYEPFVEPGKTIITGFAPDILTTGIELIRWDGDEADSDRLRVTLGDGDHTARLQNAVVSRTDRLTSDTLPDIEFRDLASFEIDEDSGDDGALDITVVTANLEGAAGYHFDLNEYDALNVEGSSENDRYTLTRSGGNVRIVHENSLTQAPITVDQGALNVRTGLGNDLVSVDVDGTALLHLPLTVDGGLGFDDLVITGAPAPDNVDEVIYTVGPLLDRGRLVYEDAADQPLMQIEFAGLEPVHDYVPANLTLYGNNATNAIDYSRGPNSGTPGLLNPNGLVTGLVSVDAYETIEFGNKAGVTIDGRAGDDQIHVADSSTPGASGELVLAGSQPTASDSTILNGTAAQDTVRIEIESPHSAKVTINGTVTKVTSTEKLVYNGLGGDDLVTILGYLGNNRFVYTPGAAPDAASLSGFDDVNNVPFLPVDLLELGVGGAIKFAGNTFFGNDNTLVVLGTAARDVVDVEAATGNVRVTTPAGLSVELQNEDIKNLVLETLEGDDEINLSSPLDVFESVAVHGGDPGASDTLNYAGSGGKITIDLDARTLTETGSAPVSFVGIEHLNVDAAGEDVSVLGGPDDDQFTVAPDVNFVEVSLAGLNTFLRVGDVDEFEINGQGGKNTLTVLATEAPNTIDIDAYAVDVAGRENVHYRNIENLNVLGLAGDDLFNVTTSSASPTIFLDGGDPIGTTPGDRIHVAAGGQGVALEAGPETDEGGIRVGSHERISFDHIEAITVADAACALVIGSGADDDITVIARDAVSTPQFAGTDGVRDFTTSVNGGPTVLWTNVGTLYIDALAGDDDIVLRTPAPNGAEWDVDVYLSGGAPSAGPDLSEGDRLVLETPWSDNIVFTPTGSDTATILIDEAVNDSLITIGKFTTLACPALNYTSDPGGIELVVYDGEGANDTLKVVGTSGQDTIVHTPGTAFDEGAFRVNSLLGITYQNMGSTAVLTADGGPGNDTLVVLGTLADDRFDVAATTGTVTLDDRLGIRQVSIRDLVLESLEGDDRFAVSAPQPYASVTALGGGPGASDVLVVTGAAGTNESFTVDPGFAAGEGRVLVNSLSIPYAGVEQIVLDANGADADSLTIEDDWADNAWSVTNGPTAGDRVRIDARESVDYEDFDTVALVNSSGTDVFNVWPTELTGFSVSLTVTGDGDDTLVAHGTPVADTLSSAPGGGTQGTATVNGVGVRFGGLGSVELSGDEGDDTFTVTPIAAVTTVVTANGPTASDVLNVTVPGNAQVTQGAESTTGTVDQTGAGDIDFYGVELLSINSSAAGSDLTVRATNDNDTIAAGLVVFTGVWINDGTVVRYNSANTNFDDLVVQGRFGSDSFSITPHAGVDITVQGGDPTLSDTVVVNGTGGDDTIDVRLTASNAGTVAVNAFGLVSLQTVEHLAINGSGGDDDLTVRGVPDGDNRFVFTPGSMPDAGLVETFDEFTGTALLPVLFEELGGDGTVTFDGNSSIAAAETALVIKGTSGSDTVRVAGVTGTVSLSTAAGNHIPMVPEDIDTLVLEMLEGDDTVLIDAPQPYESITVLAGDPGASDVLTVNGAAGADESFEVHPAFAHGDGTVRVDSLPIHYVGVEHLLLQANSDDDDSLHVDDNSADNIWTVKAGPIFGDRIRIDNRETIDYDGFADVELANDFGTDVFNIWPTELTGFSASLTVTGDGDDTLVAHGTPVVDTLASAPGGGAQGTATVNGVSVLFGGLASVELSSAEGDDVFTVTPIVGVTTVVNANGPTASDVLNVTVPAGARVTQGAESTTGTVDQTGAGDIDFYGVELLGISSNTPASTLTVRGTDDNDTIAVGLAGITAVWINDGTVVRYNAAGANFNAVTVQGRFGADSFSITPHAGVAITVQGGDPTDKDAAVVNGTSGSDTITYRPTAIDGAQVQVNAFGLVTLATIEDVMVNGLTGAVGGGGDALIVDTWLIDGSEVLTPGSAFDSGTVDFLDGGFTIMTSPSLKFRGLGQTGSLTFTGIDPGDGSVPRVDTLLYRGRDTGDTFSVSAAGVVVLNTQIPVHTPSIDTLVLAGLAGDDTFNIAGIHNLPVVRVEGGEPTASDVLNLTGTAGNETIVIDLEVLPDGTDEITGFGGVVEVVGVEQVNLNGNGGQDTLSVNGTPEDDILTYTPTGAEAGNFSLSGANRLYKFSKIAGAFTVHAGDELGDEVVVLGTNNHDVITVDARNAIRTVTVENAAGIALKPVKLGDSVEAVTALGRLGNDTFLVVPDAGIGPVPLGNLLITADGGDPAASDALVIAADDSGAPLDNAEHFVVINHSRRSDEGVVRVFRDTPGPGNDPTQLPDISFTNIEVVSPLLGGVDPVTGEPNLLILGPDVYEQNEFRATASYLGSGAALNITDLAIFPNAQEHPFVPADNDFFRVVAQYTGTLDFQVYFRAFNPELLPAGGDLNIAVYDASGDFIADSTFGNDDERVRIPVVAGQTYYLRVFGETTNLGLNTAVNGYDMTIVNTQPPVPYDLELRDIIAISTIDAAASATQFSGAAGIAPRDLSSQDDFYNEKYIYFLDGPNVGLRARILDYVGAGGDFVVTAGTLRQAPEAGDSFLIESFDTGRSQTDDVTRDNTPIVYFRLDDAIFLHDLPGNPADNNPPDRVIPIPFNPAQTRDTSTAGYRVAIFDEGTPQQPGLLPQAPIGYARQVAEGVYVFDFGSDAINPGDPNGPTTSFVLTDGSHFLSARVQIIDPATPNETAFGARGASLEIVVDKDKPPVSFGDPAVDNDGLHPDSDTGVEGQPGLFTDLITSDTTPTFWGYAEANAYIRVWVDVNADGQVDPDTDVQIAQTVAIPGDGTNQFPFGYWEATSYVDLNDPDAFPSALPLDGVRQVLVAAEDVAGNLNDEGPLDATQILQIFIDTRGPQVDGVFVTGNRDYDLFDPKPSTDGPTPLVWSIDIDFIDQPERIGGGVIVGDDAVFVIDVSGSTSEIFSGTAVGDLNNDGSPNTILDAEIAGFIALNQDLIDRGLGDISNVSIVAFHSDAFQLDMDPVAPGIQLATTPNADADNNGVLDVMQALQALDSGNMTNFEAALALASATITAVGTIPGNGNVVFLSDGFPTAGGPHADEVAALQGMGINLRAFGVGLGSSLPQLQIIDPTAVQFTTTDELLDVFQGGGGGGGGAGARFIYPAVNGLLATRQGNYLLVGDNVGPIAIGSIEFIDHTVAGDIGRTTIRLHFAQPLPDDRYTLTVSDRIKDDAGNALDGETNTFEPQESPLFPSGDGDPGEDFLARFTVDSRPEIGVWAAGSVYADINQNWIFDPDVMHQFPDNTNRDLVFKLGFTSDDVFAGKFTGPGPDEVFGTADDRAAAAGDALADGFDRLGAYGRVSGQFRWLIDTDNDGVPDLNITSIDQQGVVGPGMVDPAGINGRPLAGNFDGFLANGDEVGVFDGTRWWLDTNHDYTVDTAFVSPLNGGHPIVGDFDGDGKDDLATWADDQFWFDLAWNGYGVYSQGNRDSLIHFGFIGIRERPAAADIDQDGIDDLALFVPDRPGVAPAETAEWYVLLSNDYDPTDGLNDRIPSTVNTLNHPFSPAPLGRDLFAQFGDDFAKPVLGNFDPPVAKAEAVSNLNLTGTTGDDDLKVAWDAAASEWTVTLATSGQKKEYRLAGENVTLEFDGLGGNDTVQFIGAGGADVATLRPTSGAFTGEGYSMGVVNVESIDYDGAGGLDTVWVWGSAGNNTYTAHPGTAAMTGDGVSITVDAESIYARGGGGADTATVWDSSGNDRFEFFPVWARMSGDGYNHNLLGFKTMFGKATQGDDEVIFRGSPEADWVKSTSSTTRMLSLGAWRHADGFDTITAYGRGGSNKLVLQDSSGADTLKLTPTQANLTADRDFAAYGFGTVEATSLGGDDKVSLQDSPGDDVLRGNPAVTTLVGPGYSHRVAGFASIQAYSSGLGNDVAYLSDSTGPADAAVRDDKFAAGAAVAELSGPGYRLWTRFFDEVHAEAGTGHDVAEMVGTTGIDQLSASGAEVSLSGVNAKGPFANFAKYFDEVHATAGGGQDNATVIDGTVEDATLGAPAGVALDELAQVLWLNQFEKVEVRNSATGDQSEIDGVDKVFAYWQ